MPKQDRVTRLINVLGARWMLDEAKRLPAEPSVIGALTAYYWCMTLALTPDDHACIQEAAVSAASAARTTLGLEE